MSCMLDLENKQTRVEIFNSFERRWKNLFLISIAFINISEFSSYSKNRATRLLNNILNYNIQNKSIIVFAYVYNDK